MLTIYNYNNSIKTWKRELRQHLNHIKQIIRSEIGLHVSMVPRIKF